MEIIISGGTEYAKLKDTIAAPSGGTRVFEGNVVINSGFTASTISATTYYNLPMLSGAYLPLSGGHRIYCRIPKIRITGCQWI